MIGVGTFFGGVSNNKVGSASQKSSGFYFLGLILETEVPVEEDQNHRFSRGI